MDTALGWGLQVVAVAALLAALVVEFALKLTIEVDVIERGCDRVFGAACLPSVGMRHLWRLLLVLWYEKRSDRTN